MTKQIYDHEGRKYLRWITPATDSANKGDSIAVDVYCVLEAFSVTCPARQHAIKKLLCAGMRDKGSELSDLIGAEAAISRAIELQQLREETKVVET